MAADSEVLEAKRRVEYRALDSRRWINRCVPNRVRFEWSINPYRGCEYGCQYCYARYTHEFLERHAAAAFETEIYAKQWNEAAFRAEFAKLPEGATLAIGTATDAYQPAERRYGLTRRVLEVLATAGSLNLYLTTKSDLVARDADLFLRIQQRHRLSLTVTVTTANRQLARLLEPYAPRPELRFAALGRLAEAGVTAGVLASPVLPLLTDSPVDLDAVARAGHAAGAQFFGAGVLFLKPCSRRVFFPFLEQHFPQHLARYAARYGERAFLDGEYPARMERLIGELRTRYGLLARAPQPFVPDPAAGQLRLF